MAVEKKENEKESLSFQMLSCRAGAKEGLALETDGILWVDAGCLMYKAGAKEIRNQAPL